MPNTYVPEVVDELTTPRILVQEWVDGVKLSDREGIEAMGFTLREVMTTATKAFSYQVSKAFSKPGFPCVNSQRFAHVPSAANSIP